MNLSQHPTLRRQFLIWTVAIAATMPMVAQARSSAAVKSIIVEVATQSGIDSQAFLRMAEIESGFNPQAYHPRSKAAGLYQFIPSTARRYQLANVFDARANAEAAARLWHDNERFLETALGRTPTPGEIYLAHQQGAGNAAKLLLHKDKLASSIVGAKAVTMNGGRVSMTAGDFAAMWVSKFTSSYKPVS